MRDDLGWWVNRQNGLIVYILRGVASLFAYHLTWACPGSNPVAPTISSLLIPSTTLRPDDHGKHVTGKRLDILPHVIQADLSGAHSLVLR